jgi:hypothetical protein
MAAVDLPAYLVDQAPMVAADPFVEVGARGCPPAERDDAGEAAGRRHASRRISTQASTSARSQHNATTRQVEALRKVAALLKQVVEETATAARKKDGVRRASVERLAPKTLVEIDRRAPFVRHSLKTDDLAKARSRRDILEEADFELWAAMLLKGCVVNRVDLRLISNVSEESHGLNHVTGRAKSGFEPTVDCV